MDFHAVVAKRRRECSAAALPSHLLLLAAAGHFGGVLYAQLETADRGILPLDSSNTLEIGGIHVDVGGADAQSARYAGWRIAQRQGFQALWAKMHNAPITQAPNLPDGTLDQIVSSINVEREQIGPNRYIADLGVLFDRARAAPVPRRRGRPGPALGADAADPGDGHRRDRDQRRAAQRVAARLGAVPHVAEPDRLCARQRHGVGSVADQRARRPTARPRLVAQPARNVRRDRHPGRRGPAAAAYPGGPARARFIARHGPDNEIVGGFTLTAPNSDAIPAMMAQGAQRMDQLFAQALAAGRLTRDSSLDLPPPPVASELSTEAKPVAPVNATNAFQIQVTGKNVNVYNFAMAHLRTLPGVESATPQQINPRRHELHPGDVQGRHLAARGGAHGPRLDRRD